MSVCLIGVGSNLGDRRENVETAVDRLDQHPSIQITAISRWITSDPVGGPDGQDVFLNGVCVADSELAPHDLLAHLLDVERSLGRSRKLRWAPRTIDLDLLLVADRVIRDQQLSVPHPWMAIRPFVIGPAAEVAPAMKHPIIGRTMRQLHEYLYSSPRRVLVLSYDPQVSQQLLVQAGFAEVSTSVGQIHVPPDQHPLKPTASVYEKTYSRGEHHLTPSDESVCWEVISLSPRCTSPPVAAINDLRGQWHSAPPVRLKLILDSGTGDRALEDAVSTSGGPFLTIDIDHVPRAIHDLNAALEGMS